MSASEKLKALELRQPLGYDQVRSLNVLVAALPQIVAVVKAAEQARVCSMGCEKCREEELAPALSALDEALS